MSNLILYTLYFIPVYLILYTDMEDELQITLTNDYAILSIVRPCTIERTSFGSSRNIVSVITTAIHGGSENLLKIVVPDTRHKQK